MFDNLIDGLCKISHNMSKLIFIDLILYHANKLKYCECLIIIYYKIKIA